MQIMGATARELGFRAHFPALCSEQGVKFGCEHLIRLRYRFYPSHGWDGVIAAYNAGSPRMSNGKWENQSYVDKVHKEMGV